MHTGIKLSHDEMVVLAAISDQKLTLSEIFQDTSSLFPVVEDSKIYLESLLLRMVEVGTIVKSREFAGSLFLTTLYAIAPEILSLNHPPYSYEGWRALND